ncbi:hypothetical protein AQUCO_04500184v1 [Aquilegia coerulea]|uniref:Uncharacterized protein n=1 Tax=Aquilegia coerulea TaxID=218851 RepID=A0A2G5CM88_AQUCA|nr:hypothetical protein AQUCO_04500184v1 [Aquilegia coerulea]PIA32401.1 hypothetical protein AQUCO_04500184v1 [Aquilegia coerulea]
MSKVFEMVYPELKSTYKLGNPKTKFAIWRSKIQFVLFDLGIDYVLTDPKPIEPKPDSSESDLTHYEKWIDDDFICRHVILGTMEDNHFHIFDQMYKTAKDLMEGITKMFKNTSLAHRLFLFKKYKDCKFDVDEGIEIMDHVLRMEVMVRDLEEAGMKVPEVMQVVVLIKSLPESWEKAVNRFMMMNDKDMNYGELVRVLRIEGEWRKWKSRDEEVEDADDDDEEEEEEEEELRRGHGGGKKKVFKSGRYNCGGDEHYASDWHN